MLLIIDSQTINWNIIESCETLPVYTIITNVLFFLFSAGLILIRIIFKF